jgi:hypothetical protein
VGGCEARDERVDDETQRDDERGATQLGHGVLLGRAAVKELFPGGKTENLDRMEAIYYGVMNAFDYNGREAREARAEETAATAKDLAEALKPLADLLALANGKPDTKYPTVKRP